MRKKKGKLDTTSASEPAHERVQREKKLWLKLIDHRTDCVDSKLLHCPDMWPSHHNYCLPKRLHVTQAAPNVMTYPEHPSDQEQMLSESMTI